MGLHALGLSYKIFPTNFAFTCVKKHLDTFKNV